MQLKGLLLVWKIYNRQCIIIHIYIALFLSDLQKIGVKLHPYEIEALANSITAKGHDRNIINYRYGAKSSVGTRTWMKVEKSCHRLINSKNEGSGPKSAVQNSKTLWHCYFS